VRGCKIIANGCFLEVYVASLIIRKKYVAKIPGDIVWERAVNLGLTRLDIVNFQDQKLPFPFRIFRWLFSSALKRATLVIAPSQVLCNLVESWGVPRESIIYIPNSVDTSFYLPKQSEKHFQVIAVNRLVSWKHVDQIIVACASKNLSLAIVGDGPEKARLQSLASRLGANVRFFGEVSKDEVADLLSRSQVYILNSTFEATAYSLLEARSCGLIAISNAYTGAAEIISNQVDGYLVQNSDSSSLILALDKYFSLTQNERIHMRDKAVLSTRTFFDREVNFCKILELLDRI
jgi:glycosyltransferase involved in cell wall biosynthesis